MVEWNQNIAILLGGEPTFTFHQLFQAIASDDESDEYELLLANLPGQSYTTVELVSRALQLALIAVKNVLRLIKVRYLSVYGRMTELMTVNTELAALLESTEAALTQQRQQNEELKATIVNLMDQVMG